MVHSKYKLLPIGIEWIKNHYEMSVKFVQDQLKNTFKSMS